MANTPVAATKRYIDLDLDFLPHPISKDVRKRYDVAAVLRSCRHLVLLSAYEKPFHPEIGAGIRGYLFEPMSILTSTLIRNEIERVIRVYEPRAKPITIHVNPVESDNSYFITMEIEVLGQQIPITLNVTLKRLR